MLSERQQTDKKSSYSDSIFETLNYVQGYEGTFSGDENALCLQNDVGYSNACGFQNWFKGTT